MANDPREGVDGTVLAAFGAVRAVVVGDVMLDGYVTGSVTRLSPDGPFPVVDVTDEVESLGGAGNVAANLSALGATVALVSVVGEDRAGDALTRLAGTQGIDVSGVVRDARRVTLEKQRVMGEGRIISRVDRGSTGAVAASTAERMAEHLERALQDADLVIVSDYRYGVIGDLARRVLDRASGPTIVIDSKDLHRFRHSRPDVITSNYAEVMDLIGQDATARERLAQVERMADAVLQATGARLAAVTLDADGVAIVESDSFVHVPAMGNGADPCGAGDTFTAALGLALAAGASPQAAAQIASRASAIVVERSGTAVCSIADLRGCTLPRVCDGVDTLVDVVAWHRSMGRSIVFTNGCFDVLHAGHVASLREAAALGDVLVVGVNGDDSVRRLKGPDRPVNEFADRAAVIAGLSAVDHVVCFDEDTPLALLRSLRPDVYCKGGDYRGRDVPEAALVESWGGRFEVTSYLDDRSTTATVERMRASAAVAT